MPSDAMTETTERQRFIDREFSPTVRRNAEIGGYAGMAAIHGATLPVSIGVILGLTDHLPPLSMVLLVWIGLILFFIRALVRFDWLYLISNGIGLIANSVLLVLIAYS
jgi:hypothetical protein